MEKNFGPPLEENLLHFLNWKYKELDDFGDFGKKSTLNAGVTATENPHKISANRSFVQLFRLLENACESSDAATSFLAEGANTNSLVSSRI